MISIVQNGSEYDVRFPYDEDLKDIVKDTPGRRWVPESKKWAIPAARLGFLLAALRGTKYENDVVIKSNERINVNETLDAATSIPNYDLGNFTPVVQDGYYIFNHQIDTIKYAAWRYANGLKSGFLLADQPGAGKSLSVCNVALYMKQKYNFNHCLIIACVNSAKYNWLEDIEKHTNGFEVPYLLGTRLKRDGTERLSGSGKEKYADLATLSKYGKGEENLPYFIVTNIESIQYSEGQKYLLEQKLIELINSGYINMIAVDEIHRNASMTSRQGKLLLDVKKKTGSNAMWIPMTGTPIVSKPTDVFLPLRLIDGHSSSSFYMWCQEYCIYGGFNNHDIIGYKNIGKMKSMLMPNMLRRLKKDILDLPPKIHYTEYIDNSDIQRRMYSKLLSEARTKADTKEKIQAMGGANMLKLRQINGSPELVDNTIDINAKGYLSKNAKLKRLLELVDDILEDPDEKIVLFSNWVEPLRTIHHFLSKKYKICCYTGTMKQDVRQKHKEAFMKDPERRIIIGTVGAMGTSHTLTAARNVIFYDCPWNPSDMEQCEDRCHRPGTTNSVNVYKLIVRDTVDEVVNNILDKKEATSKFIVDNQIDIEHNPELMNMILGE